MSQQEITPAAIEEETGGTINWREFASDCLKRWYWFAGSVILFLIAGTLYIKHTTPTYTRSALVQVRDDNHGSPMNTSFSNTFSDLGMFSASADVDNERYAIKSPRLIARVVDALDLEVDYTTRKGMRKMPVYGTNLPYTVTFVDGGEYSLSLKMQLPDSVSPGTLYKFTEKVNGDKIKHEGTVTFDPMSIDTLSTPIGRIVIRPNASYIKGAPEDEMTVTYTSPKLVTELLSTRITSDIINDRTTVIELKLTDTSAARAEDIINKLVEVYNLSWVEDRNIIATATSHFINDRLVRLEGELSDVDSDISSYKSHNLLPDVTEASRLYLQQATRTSDEIMDLNNQLQMARYVRDYLSNPSHSSSLLPANSGIGTSAVDNQINEYNRLVIERNNLAASSSEANPRVRQYDTSISEMRAAILLAIDNQIVSLSTSIKNLQRSEAGATARIAANPTQAKYLLNVERQQKVKESLYLYLLQKREENELSQTFAPYNTRILQDATGPRPPVAPRSPVILALCFFLGLAVPAALLYIMQIMDNTVRSRKDIDDMNLPFLGLIPQAGRRRTTIDRLLRRNTDTDKGIVVQHGNTDITNEAFRMLRSNIDFMTQSRKGTCRVFMVTSAIPGSGKTYVSANLASAISLKGERTLLIDMDLRRHSLSNQLAGTRRQGLSAYLGGGNLQPQDFIIKGVDGNDNLDLMVAGAVPPNPSELLHAERLTQLIEWARTVYDTIIIDCPPSEAVADARLIGRLCDYTLYVVRAGNLDRRMLPTIAHIYEQKTFPNLTVVLNGDTSDGVRGYGYGYNYNTNRRK